VSTAWRALAHLAPVHPSDRRFLGYALADYQTHTGLDPAALARRLRCSPTCLAPLALWPRLDPIGPSYQADLRRLGDRVGLDPKGLDHVLRQLHAPTAAGDLSRGAVRW
jgi:hypothetical protein